MPAAGAMAAGAALPCGAFLAGACIAAPPGPPPGPEAAAAGMPAAGAMAAGAAMVCARTGPAANSTAIIMKEPIADITLTWAPPKSKDELSKSPGQYQPGQKQPIISSDQHARTDFSSRGGSTLGVALCASLAKKTFRVNTIEPVSRQADYHVFRGFPPQKRRAHGTPSLSAPPRIDE